MRKPIERYQNPLLKRETAPEIGGGVWVRVGVLAAAFAALGFAWTNFNGQSSQQAEVSVAGPQTPGGE